MYTETTASTHTHRSVSWDLSSHFSFKKNKTSSRSSAAWQTDSRGAERWLGQGNVYRGGPKSNGPVEIQQKLLEKSKGSCPNGPRAEATLESEREEVAEQKEKNGHEVPQQNQSRAELEEQLLQTGKKRPAGAKRDTRAKTRKRKRFRLESCFRRSKKSTRKTDGFRRW